MTEETKHSQEVNIERLARDMTMVRELLVQVFNKIVEAEAEVPEKMRRFIMYMHDLHDVVYMYESRGLPAPEYVKMEMQRCDDRYRQLLEEQHADGGAFERVRREMSKDPNNRWDHSRFLSKPNGACNETRT